MRYNDNGDMIENTNCNNLGRPQKYNYDGCGLCPQPCLTGPTVASTVTLLIIYEKTIKLDTYNKHQMT